MIEDQYSQQLLFLYIIYFKVVLQTGIFMGLNDKWYSASIIFKGRLERSYKLMFSTQKHLTKKGTIGHLAQTKYYSSEWLALDVDTTLYIHSQSYYIHLKIPIAQTPLLTSQNKDIGKSSSHLS